MPPPDPGPVVFCAACRVNTATAVVASYLDRTREGFLQSRFLLATCPRCDGVSMVVQDFEGPAISHGLEVDSWSNGKQVFPARGRTLPDALPSRVERACREAIVCEEARAWLATAVMAGRALEAVAKEHDASTKNLADGLAKMKAAGVISDELLAWSQELRFLRNIGAHASDQDISEEDARDALDFLEAIIETIYVLRERHAKMRARREGSNPSGGDQ